MTSSHITCISLRFFAVSCSCLGAPPAPPPPHWASTKGSIHKVSQAPEDVGWLWVWGYHWFLYRSQRSDNSISHVDLTLDEVLVTLWIWGQAYSTQNSPLQGFLCAGLPYCSGVSCLYQLWYTCISMSVWVVEKNFSQRKLQLQITCELREEDTLAMLAV